MVNYRMKVCNLFNLTTLSTVDERLVFPLCNISENRGEMKFDYKLVVFSTAYTKEIDVHCNKLLYSFETHIW